MNATIQNVKLTKREAAEELLRRDPGMDAELLRRADFFDQDAIPLCVFRMPYKFNVGFRAAHTHEFDEMLIVTGGTAVHQYDGETVSIKRGDVFLIPEGQRHGYAMPAGCRMENINLLFDFSALGIDWGDLAQLDGFKVCVFSTTSLTTAMPFDCGWRTNEPASSRLLRTAAWLAERRAVL